MGTLLIAELVERYLRTHGGDPTGGDDFFDTDGPGGRILVHLSQLQANADLIAIQVSAPRSFPAADRPRLTKLARRWNRSGELVEAILCRSTEPGQIGVVAEGIVPIASGTGYQEFSDVVDTAIARAAEFFAQLI